MRNTHRSILAIVMAFTILTGTVAAADNAAPVAENLELTTYRNVSVGGKMTARTPGNAPVQFIVTTEPVKGTLDVSDDGYFVYTPKENKKGRDYFGYKAVDEQGNESQEATVIIRIQRKDPTIQYTDTDGLPCDYAASHLAESGIFTGVQVGGDYYFRPDEIVSRQEFASMCMAASKEECEQDVFTEEDLPLSYNEASVILNEILHISPVQCLASDALPGMAEESAQAVSNLRACGILQECSTALSEPLTRQEAALMILRTREILNAR